MPKKLTTPQCRSLLCAFAYGPDDGWDPRGIWDNHEVPVAARLCTNGLLANIATDASPRYVLTPAGREAIGVDTTKPPKQVRKAVKRGLTWLGFEDDSCGIRTGRDVPSVVLDEGRAEFRGCRFALSVVDGIEPYQHGPLRALGKYELDTDLLWDALAQFMTELGVPTYVEKQVACYVGFWPDDEG